MANALLLFCITGLTGLSSMSSRVSIFSFFLFDSAQEEVTQRKKIKGTELQCKQLIDEEEC